MVVLRLLAAAPLLEYATVTSDGGTPFRYCFRLGDAATGTNVLTALHRKLGSAPGDVNLAKLFAQLGVSLKKGEVQYDASAPLAAVRKAITRK